MHLSTSARSTHWIGARAVAGAAALGVVLATALLTPSSGVASAAGARKAAEGAAACPGSVVLPLTRDGVSRAAVATLRHVAHEEHVAKRNGVAHPVPVRGARVTASVVAPEAGVRGRTVRHQCGGRIWRSTVVVYVFLPRLRFSASLSSQIFFVSRFAHGYRVWERIH